MRVEKLAEANYPDRSENRQEKLVPIYEVFGQEAPGGPFVHAGSVVAPDVELAKQYARNSFARREEAVRLWIVPRDCVHELADVDLLQPPCDHRYRMGRYYRVTTEKRRRVRAKARGEMQPAAEATP